MSKFQGAFRADFNSPVGDSLAGILAVANPEGEDVYVTRVLFDATTKATAACTVDVGVAGLSTSSSDNLIDGLDVGTAAGVFDNVKNAGTNGKAGQKWAAGQFITVSKATGASAGLVGKLLIEYVRLS